VTPVNAHWNLSSRSATVATPVFSIQQRPESSAVPIKGALAKTKGFRHSHLPRRRLHTGRRKKTVWKESREGALMPPGMVQPRRRRFVGSPDSIV
jgi:hypothetical protein